jgi:anaerobic magnesium-protoporphyrin IX monomethyl ester cyclase
MKVFLIRSPRYYWPFINEYDNFLLPQSLPCLATVLKKEGIDIRVFDCSPLKMGWQGLRNLLKEQRPDVVGVGDSESLYAHEAVRVLRIAKEANPETVTVAGGAHFSNLVEDNLLNYPIDFIVKGEGEYTFLELIRELREVKSDFETVKGIAFKEDGKIIETSPRPLIENLDELPLPAYELMPIQEYGKARFLFSPGGITIHHSRGCIDKCKFCVWWVQMAERKLENDKINLYPRWRTKSVQRTIEEIKLLYYKYKKRFLIFVDDSWNINQAWNAEFAELLLKEEIRLGWFAFMRADCLLRDEKAGVLKRLVKSGLSHISIGVERAESNELKAIGKNCYSRDMIEECMHILKNKYPQVFRQVTFIVGVRSETKESLLQQCDYAKAIAADYPAFHPLTPVPGTESWREAKQKGWLEIEDFRYYDWATPVMSSKYLTREEIEYFIYLANKKFISPLWFIKGLLSPFKFKRNMYIWWLMVILRIFTDSIKKVINPFKIKEYTKLVKPRWYDS